MIDQSVCLLSLTIIKKNRGEIEGTSRNITLTDIQQEFFPILTFGSPHVVLSNRNGSQLIRLHIQYLHIIAISPSWLAIVWYEYLMYLRIFFGAFCLFVDKHECLVCNEVASAIGIIP